MSKIPWWREDPTWFVGVWSYCNFWVYKYWLSAPMLTEQMAEQVYAIMSGWVEDVRERED